MMVPGSLVFDMKAAHGLPLDFTIDAIAERGMFIEWPSFIERARQCGRWDFQTYRDLSEALEDSSISRKTSAAILDAFKSYVLAYPQ
jgi:alanyl-tRNA synthetase